MSNPSLNFLCLFHHASSHFYPNCCNDAVIAVSSARDATQLPFDCWMDCLALFQPPPSPSSWHVVHHPIVLCPFPLAMLSADCLPHIVYRPPHYAVSHLPNVLFDCCMLLCFERKADYQCVGQYHDHNIHVDAPIITPTHQPLHQRAIDKRD